MDFKLEQLEEQQEKEEEEGEVRRRRRSSSGEMRPEGPETVGAKEGDG